MKRSYAFALDGIAGLVLTADPDGAGMVNLTIISGWPLALSPAGVDGPSCPEDVFEANTILDLNDSSTEARGLSGTVGDHAREDLSQQMRKTGLSRKRDRWTRIRYIPQFYLVVQHEMRRYMTHK